MCAHVRVREKEKGDGPQFQKPGVSHDYGGGHQSCGYCQLFLDNHSLLHCWPSLISPKFSLPPLVNTQMPHIQTLTLSHIDAPIHRFHSKLKISISTQ